MTTIDLLVIGGGINGVGIAADAAGRGLSVTLCESHDLASATSSASSKLIHGGLRYLEHYEFKLVKESLTERSILCRIAPHLVRPQEFILPHCPWLRPYWLIRLGLFLYDHLGLNRYVPKSRALSSKLIETLGLKNKIKKALCYYDCTVDDSRLVCHVALQAKQKGAEILTRTKVISATRHQTHWTVKIEDQITKKIKEIQASCIVNATGPWVDTVCQQVLNVKPNYSMRLVKGSHIIIRNPLPHSYAFILQNQDERVIFTIPYQKDFLLIGTTDVPVNSMNTELTVDASEIDYLCQITNEFFETKISPDDIIYQYWGVRPLQDNLQASASKVTRDFAFDLHASPDKAPALSIYGGKITTYRTLAEQVIEQLKPFFPKVSAAWTHQAPLPGGDIDVQDLESYQQQLATQFSWLPPKQLRYYFDNYGTRILDLLEKASQLSDLGTYFGAHLYQLEVDFLIREEWAITTEDILWRRGKMGLFLNEQEVNRLSDYIEKMNH